MKIAFSLFEKISKGLSQCYDTGETLEMGSSPLLCAPCGCVF